MCVRVAHIWLIPEKNVPTNIIFMNMLLVDAKVCPIFQSIFKINHKLVFLVFLSILKIYVHYFVKPCIVNMPY
jgi:hypothetical protein